MYPHVIQFSTRSDELARRLLLRHEREQALQSLRPRRRRLLVRLRRAPQAA